MAEIFALIVQQGWLLLEMRRDSQSLEDVFKALTRGDERLHTGSVLLATGQRLQAGASIFEVATAVKGRITLRDGSHSWDYDGALLRRDGEAQVAAEAGDGVAVGVE